MLRRIVLGGIKLHRKPKNRFSLLEKTSTLQNAAHVLQGHQPEVKTLGGNIFRRGHEITPLLNSSTNQLAIFIEAAEIDVSLSKIRFGSNSCLQRLNCTGRITSLIQQNCVIE